MQKKQVMKELQNVNNGNDFVASKAQYCKALSTNHLVNVAEQLLQLVASLAYLPDEVGATELRRILAQAMEAFEKQAKFEGISITHVLSAHYLLCTVLDEVVFNSAWSARHQWAEQSLLATFHQDGNGGETCFERLKCWQEAPIEHLELLELMFICLSLGFQGKYRLGENATEGIEALRQRIYAVIQQYRGRTQSAQLF